MLGYLLGELANLNHEEQKMLRSVIAAVITAVGLAVPAIAQGPVILMGIDAEDGGPGSHGPVSAYADVIGNGMLPNVTNGGSGILVIGGGKDANDDVTEWWDELALQLGVTVTYVNGAAGISGQSLAGFALVGVASSIFGTSSGGLTDAENDAFTGRASDVATHVNGGGGLFGTSQDDIANPYGYLGTIGGFTFAFPSGFDEITATPEGLAVGIDDTVMDICCWHDEYLTFPNFLEVLAVNDSTGNPCAIGGVDVVIVQGIALTPTGTQTQVGMPHTVTASVADSQGSPIANTLVDFEITRGPHLGLVGMGMTDAGGMATFSWTGLSNGLDVIEACFTDNLGTRRCASATNEWISDCFVINFETEDDFSTLLVNGQDISSPAEFGSLLSISGTGPNAGAAIFDSSIGGANAQSQDPDLLIGGGNILILQNGNNASQSQAGVFDSPNDDPAGGALSFMFLGPIAAVSIDLVDIDSGSNEMTTVILTDGVGNTRTYFVPAGWTGDVSQGTAGSGRLELSKLVPQMGHASTATAVEDQGFDGSDVMSIDVNLGSSGGVDNVSWCPGTKLLDDPSPRPRPGRRNARGGRRAQRPQF